MSKVVIVDDLALCEFLEPSDVCGMVLRVTTRLIFEIRAVRSTRRSNGGQNGEQLSLGKRKCSESDFQRGTGRPFPLREGEILSVFRNVAQTK